MIQKAQRKVRIILMNLARALLIIAVILAILEQRNLLLFSAIALFVFTFLPTLFGFLFKKESTTFFDITILILIFGVLSYWEIRGVYANYFVLAVITNVAQAAVIGLLGLTLVYSFFKYAKLDENILMIAVFSFCFSFSIAVVLELGEIVADELLNFNIHSAGVFGLTGDLLSYLGGCLLVSVVGYISLKNGKLIFVSTILEGIVEKNAGWLGLKIENENHPDKIKELVKKGEHQKLEFKSTLRKNLHTSQLDKQIEHAVLKTISAYLNSDGGTLLVGVNDKGEINGIGADDFPNNEHVNRHLNNLIASSIGTEFAPFIRTDIIEVDGKNVVKIDCKQSNKEVFLKGGNEEEFYVRRGQHSMPLSGSSLLKYIENKFRKKN